MKEVFKYIKADPFFADYLPLLRNYKHKIRGKDGNGKPIGFSEAEIQQIGDGVQKLSNDLLLLLLSKKRGKKL